MLITAKEIRKRNLEYLLEKSECTKTSFAVKCGLSQAAFSHIIGVNPYRNIGNSLARKIESNLGLKHGYLDVPHCNGRDEKKDHDMLITAKVSLSVDAAGLVQSEERIEELVNFISVKNEFAALIKTEGLFPRINSLEFIVFVNEPVAAGDEIYIKLKDGSSMIKKVSQITDGYYKLSLINPSTSPPITILISDIASASKISAIVKK